MELEKTDSSDEKVNGEAMREIQNGAKYLSGVRPVEVEAAAPKPEARTLGELSLKGLLSNKLLSALPAEDFARLLSHLEPVSLSSGEELYRLGEATRFA